MIVHIFDPRTLEVQEDLGFEASSQIKASLRPNIWGLNIVAQGFVSMGRLRFESEFFKEMNFRLSPGDLEFK